MKKINPPDWAGKPSAWRPGKNEGELFRHSTDLGPIVYRDRDRSVLVLKTKAVLRNAEEYARARAKAQEANSLAATQKRVDEFVSAGLIKRPVHIERLEAFDSTWRHILCIKGTGISISRDYTGGADVSVCSDVMVHELKKLMPEEQFLSSIPANLNTGHAVDLDLIRSFLDLEGLEIRFYAAQKKGDAVIRDGKVVIVRPLTKDEAGSLSSDDGPSIDAGMPGNEDGAWGSSSYDGWLVD